MTVKELESYCGFCLETAVAEQATNLITVMRKKRGLAKGFRPSLESLSFLASSMHRALKNNDREGTIFFC